MTEPLADLKFGHYMRKLSITNCGDWHDNLL